MNVSSEFILFFENQGFTPIFFGVVLANEVVYPGGGTPGPATVASADFSKDPNAFPADATVTYTGQFVDYENAPVTQLLSLTLSLYKTNSPTVVNGVDRINILNLGRGSVDAFGKVTVTLSGADTGLLVANDQYEYRTMILDWTYSSPTGVAAGRRRILLKFTAFEENP